MGHGFHGYVNSPESISTYQEDIHSATENCSQERIFFVISLLNEKPVFWCPMMANQGKSPTSCSAFGSGCPRHWAKDLGLGMTWVAPAFRALKMT